MNIEPQDTQQLRAAGNTRDHSSEFRLANAETSLQVGAEKHAPLLDFEKLQALFQIGGENPIALRAIGPKGSGLPCHNYHFDALTYPRITDRWTAFADRALKLNDRGWNIYTCFNPILPSFSGGAVADSDIECRRLLLIDLDRKSGTGAPATDEEVLEAYALAEVIEAEWLNENWGQLTKVMSGNGVHLYGRLDDLPNDEDTKKLVQTVLRSLAARFNTETIKVDTSVLNAGQVTKVPGTVARKGEASADRPYRKAMFI